MLEHLLDEDVTLLIISTFFNDLQKNLVHVILQESFNHS